MDGPEETFVLSALLQGHTDDVRSICCLDSATETPRICSTSRDGTAKVWARRDHVWREERSFPPTQGFLNSSAFLAGRDQAGSQGYLVVGGQDALIQVYDLDKDGNEPCQTLLGHGANVCCVHVAGAAIVSGSWDCTARIWETERWTCTRTLSHSAAVWDVLSIDVAGYEDTAITACADGLIRLFKASENATVLFKGHQGPVRTLAKLLPEDPECNLFASGSNDGKIIIWNLQGDMVTTLAGHDSFIYSLVAIPRIGGGGMASSGEEGIVKIWDEEEGEESQELRVPALSVWSLASLPNGDLALACSDKLIWIFTRDVTRKADGATEKTYETLMTNFRSRTQRPSMPLSEPEDLVTSGTEEGMTKLIKGGDGTVHAHQWSSGSWVDVGVVTSRPGSEPTARPPSAKTEFEGRMYNAVIDIDYQDGAEPLKLAFNFEDDASEVARSFVSTHGLPEAYIDRIRTYLQSL